MIDADTVPPGGFIDRMLEVDRPIVSGVTHIFKHAQPNRGGPMVKLALWKRRRQADGTYCADNVRSIPDEGILEDEGLMAGAFCMMVHSDVLESMNQELPWFKTSYVEETQEKLESEDLYFCRKAIEKGWKVSVLCDLICSHWKTINLKDVALLVQNLMKQQELASCPYPQKLEAAI